jgi:hypothetical protein
MRMYSKSGGLKGDVRVLGDVQVQKVDSELESEVSGITVWLEGV